VWFRVTEKEAIEQAVIAPIGKLREYGGLDRPYHADERHGDNDRFGTALAVH
jgi:hypothetical protein